MEENMNVEVVENIEDAPANVEDIASELSGDTVEAAEGSESETTEEVVNGDDAEFNPDEMDFEDGANVFEGYDLGKFAETLNLEDEANVKIITSEMQKLKEKGFSQEQAEYFVEQQVRLMQEYEADIEPAPVTQAEVKKVLNESLTKEEKLNYKPILGWLKEDAKSIGLTDRQVQEAMQNPILVKLMNGFYKRAAGKGGVKTVEVKAPESNVTMDFGTAMKQVQDKILAGTSKEDVIKFAKGLETSLKGDQLDQFKVTFGRIFGLK